MDSSVSIGNSAAALSSHKSSYALAVSHVVTELIQAYDAGDTLNFTKLKGTAARKYKLRGIPKLADILQALPISYRAKLWPFLQTKPVRTASGVAVVGASVAIVLVGWLGTISYTHIFIFIFHQPL
jgi:elongator complex protein 3